MNTGTPKTLSDAIGNGIFADHPPHRRIRDILADHVLDFLRQKFGAAYLRMDDTTSREEAMDVLRTLARDIGVDTSLRAVSQAESIMDRGGPVTDGEVPWERRRGPR